MYKNLGYIVYRTVIDYYAGPGDDDEDAYGKNGKMRDWFDFLIKTSWSFWTNLMTEVFLIKSVNLKTTGNLSNWILTLIFTDMRKAMPRDVDKKSMIPLKHPVHCDEVE